MYEYSLLQHNWLVMQNGNRDFRRRLPMLKGVVCDLGCGRRPFEKDVLAVADRYVGVDWANTLHGLHADIVADLNRPLPIAAAAADTVMAISLLEHLHEPQCLLDEANRIMKPGGGLYLTVPFQWWVHEAPHDYFRFTRYGLERLLQKAGFVDIRIEESSGFWTMWFLKLNYQTLRLIGGPKLLQWVARAALLPFWFANQLVAPALDRLWREPLETQGYYVTARKAAGKPHH